MIKCGFSYWHACATKHLGDVTDRPGVCIKETYAYVCFSDFISHTPLVNCKLSLKVA